MEFVIEVGDTVSARKETPQGIIPLEYVVTGLSHGVHGSPLGPLTEADGWSFEVIRKGDPGLPQTLSDLAAWTVFDRTKPIRIIGPVDGVWQIPGGARVNSESVLGWMPWADYTPPPPPPIVVPTDHPDIPVADEENTDA